MKNLIIPTIIGAGLAILPLFANQPPKQEALASQLRVIPLEEAKMPVIANTEATDKIKAITANNSTLTDSQDPEPLTKAKKFLAGRKHRYTDQYLELIFNYCNNNQHCLFSIIAISGAESSFGTAGKANDGKGQDNNFWGFFKGGDRGYDPDKKEMAETVAKAFNPANNTYHSKIISEKGEINERLARIYHGNDRHNTWVANTSKFYKNLLNS